MKTMLMTGIRSFVVAAIGVATGTPGAHAQHEYRPHEGPHTHPHNRPHERVAADPSRFFTDREGAPLELPTEDDAFLFAVFGDRTGGPASGIEVLKQAVADVNLIEPDLVMTVGDLINGYNQTDEWMKQMEEYKGVMSYLLCPWFPVAGNHDVYWRGPNRPPEEHEDRYELHFGPLWYAFEHKDSYFIVLYTDEPDPETGERNFNKPASQRMSPEQFEWLGEALERGRDARHIFVFLHHPRWLGGNYGNDWERVHERLAAAGNVRAVFAGHIHRMRYDGIIDGIEYVTLATVGGGQGGAVPKVGYLHQYHLVMVRDEQIAMASVPVGEVLDVRAITGQVSDETRRLAGVQPQIDQPIRLEGDGRSFGELRAAILNPTSRPVEVTVVPTSDDNRWELVPDHRHLTIEPGQTGSAAFTYFRAESSLDDAFAMPELSVRMDYLAETARFPIPERRVALPVVPQLAAPERPEIDRTLTLGGGDAMYVPSALLDVPDGPMTLECWFRGHTFGGRVGLVAKTENSDYGFFVSNGVPSFSIFLGNSYAEARADEPILGEGRWHHLAGVYDGEEVRLYLDGELVATERRSGKRRTNDFPLMIGSDVDSRGNPMSFFTGEIDEVRLSTTARYTDNFNPREVHAPDEHTALLLHFYELNGPWTYDASGNGAHPIRIGDPGLMDVEWR